jgi:hypothetical protein
LIPLQAKKRSARRFCGVGLVAVVVTIVWPGAATSTECERRSISTPPAVKTVVHV